MKSYLNLIPISAKIHKRQNRMTILCIIFAVFLVTAIFSMADMAARMEYARLLEKHGRHGLEGIGDGAAFQTMFSAAVVLFVLVLVAGVLMIASSINSKVAQRTKFFGMMRCIGMSKEQILRFVRLEAAYWCKTAVPIGVLCGVVITWALCAALRLIGGVGGEFSHIPLFGISPIGIISGSVSGIVTVLIAASAPAKRAAKVSPVAAISGGSDPGNQTSLAVNTQQNKIETALGIQHAISAKKNLLLMTGSFALSIILFLCFSVLIDLVGYVMPQSANTSDIDISGVDASNSIDAALLDEIRNMNGVKRVFGRRSCLDIPTRAMAGQRLSDTLDLISYDAFDLDCLLKEKQLTKGSDISQVYGDSRYVLTIQDNAIPLEIADVIEVNGEKLTIAGMLRFNPFSSDGSASGKLTVITSDETFTRLTEITGYSLVMVQTLPDATDDDVAAIHNLVGEQCAFRDIRDQRTDSTYMAFLVVIYGFLAIIALVTVLSIMNSISMSVSARTRQYGIMRAVGMETRQLIKMLTVEAATYALCGCAVGCGVGLAISKWMYDFLITSHYSYAIWSVPVASLVIILLFVAFATVAAIHSPAKRIRNLSVTETIQDL